MAIGSVINSYSSVLAYSTKRASETTPLVTTTTSTATKPSISDSSVQISDEAKQRYSLSRQVAASTGKSEFDTNQGAIGLDIDTYFTPPGGEGVDLDSVPLLMPTQKNIDALSRHISANMPGFLSSNGIAAPPASIRFDNMGRVQLPSDYPYADAFKKALADNPVMDRALRTSAALASTMVEMKKSLPFQQEYAAAATKSEVDAIVSKYSYLFNSDRHVDVISLNFSSDGTLTITQDGKSLSS